MWEEGKKEKRGKRKEAVGRAIMRTPEWQENCKKKKDKNNSSSS